MGPEAEQGSGSRFQIPDFIVLYRPVNPLQRAAASKGWRKGTLFNLGVDGVRFQAYESMLSGQPVELEFQFPSLKEQYYTHGQVKTGPMEGKGMERIWIGDVQFVHPAEEFLQRLRQLADDPALRAACGNKQAIQPKK